MLDQNRSPLDICQDFMRAVKLFEDEMTLAGPGPFKLSLTQMYILKVIGGSNEQLNAGDLTDKLPMHSTNPTYNLKKLINTGLVQREQCPYDKRAVLLSLTEKGKDTLPKIDAYLERIAKKVLDRLPSMGLGTTT